MKKRVYKFGKMVTAPFYYIHKALLFMENNDLFGLLISAGVMLLGIGTFLYSANFHDGEWISDILFFFFCSMLFSLLTVVCYAGKILIVPLLLLVFGALASLYQFFSQTFDAGDQPREKNKTVDPPYRRINPGCGMNPPMC